MTQLNWRSIFSNTQCSITRASKLAVIWTPSAASVNCTISALHNKQCLKAAGVSRARP
ncbi:hypothetical protein PTT_16751 [Pyrenophora teres f. teres 0-1]|uniref:Uncharacterized protein n=1 Tax=Pyrenophora teres f. teres (strain 0-1) TaxID=861557 RepID=E3S2Y4_PYRTT|nr:hypothetical protein PTT_16751 [Pyrenophora teres f. teres 0-1]